MVMAIPKVFGAGALMFGLSYLFVVVLHHGAFALKAEGAAAKAIWGIAIEQRPDRKAGPRARG